MLIHHFLENSAALQPDKVAIIHRDQRVPYGQLNQAANDLASGLVATGAQRGDRVLLLLENGVEYITSYYAALKAGMVTVPISPETRSASLQNILTTTPRVIICSPKAEKSLHDIDTFPSSLQTIIPVAPRLSWQQHPFQIIPYDDICTGSAINPAEIISDTDLASIIFTSGSTGTPKGVMLSHANIVANTHSIIQYLELSAEDRQMVILPFFYVMGKSLLNTHIASGGSLVINNNAAYPAAVIQQMVSEEVTGFSGVPSTYAYLLHRSPLKSYRDKLTCLRYCSQAGGHMSRHVKAELLDILPEHTRLYVMYGATEASARLTYVEPQRLRDKIDSIGIPIPGVTLRVIGQNGTILPDGEIGELVADGNNIMSGYWNDPQGSSAVLCCYGYRTGDFGYRDPDGYFHLTGRKDSQLKVRGHRINPQEIEEALMATNLLIETAVIGRDDSLQGQKIAAYAVAKHGDITEQDVLGKCLKWLPRYKVPSEIWLLPSLPKNSSGKINRQELASLQKSNNRISNL